MPPGASSDAIFADEGALTASYRPDRFDFRAEEVTAIRSALSPAVLSEGVACVLVCGPPAQGKRTAVTVAVETLESRSTATEPRLVPISCPQDATAYKLAIGATNELRDDAALAPGGYSRETAFRRLRGRIEDAAGTPMLRLDRVQRVEPPELETFLAGLLDGVDAPSCAIVAVADGLDYRNALAVDTRRRFDQVVFVSPYERAQRRSIVADRAETAFQSGACPDAIVEDCLARAAETDEPLRTAFDLLRRAGERATRAGAAAITPDHVAAAHTVVERDRLAERLARCSAHEWRTLSAVASADDGRFESIYADYRQRCREDGVAPNRERSVHNYLDALIDASLVDATEGRSSTGGRYFEYAVRPDSQLVADARDVLEAEDADQ